MKRSMGMLAVGWLGLASSGCLVGVAGIVEATNDTKTPDPMGHEYAGTDGRIGWYADADQTSDLNRFAFGVQHLGCETSLGEARLDASCPGMPQVSAMQEGNKVFRLCDKGTERMQCRMAWEKIHVAMGAGPKHDEG